MRTSRILAFSLSSAVFMLGLGAGPAHASDDESKSGVELGIHVGRMYDNSTALSSTVGLSVTKRNLEGIGFGAELVGHLYEPELSSVSDGGYEYLSTSGGLVLSRLFQQHGRLAYLFEGFAGLSSGDEHLLGDGQCDCLLPVVEPRFTVTMPVKSHGALGASLILNSLFADSETYLSYGIGARYIYKIH